MDSSEGGWQGGPIWDTGDLLEQIDFELPNDSSGALLEALLDALPSTDWSEKNPYGYNRDEFPIQLGAFLRDDQASKPIFFLARSRRWRPTEGKPCARHDREALL